MTLFAIHSLRAARVNMVMNDYVAGLPSPLSFLGLADLHSRRLGLTPWQGGILPVFHGVHISEGRTKPEMEPNGGSFGPIEIVEDLTGTVDVSLLLSLQGSVSATALKQTLIGTRIAGGLIQNDDFVVEEVTQDGSAFRGLKRGYALTPARSPERSVFSRGDPASLAQVVDLLYPQDRAAGFGWPIPAAIGYHLLEDPATTPPRLRTRSKTIPHVFAEPLLGIAECISVRSPQLTKLSAQELEVLMWRWHSEGSLLLGNQTYSPDSTRSSYFNEVTSHG